MSCIGHGDTRPVEAAAKQMTRVAYCASIYFSTNVCEELCQYLVDSTNGHMKRAYIVNSGQLKSAQFNSPKWKRGLKWNRIRGDGGGNETGQAILPGEGRS